MFKTLSSLDREIEKERARARGRQRTIDKHKMSRKDTKFEALMLKTTL